ncbi:TetR/AcrR family transcriptional regulator [Aquihabitans sp. G128]|uniref:TetR/AcrR family transcriptional regulator n=1 Tax=Aquihabitans sp. G128 TaxID=2849779 RepID=UPI001C2438D2|nr:TetR/AcrR family transcriptional regulator [Aquihabitans sp. G128]QXC61917.1 TetR/AcrR family transcriptional regulator [Aquihabitans sp. G128]
MSSSAVQLPTAATRRHLSDRQAKTVHKLTEAAVVELIEVGYPALTVRTVAKRAGVAPATAYTYFGSKEHLVAEVFWRRFEAQEVPPTDRRRSPAARATDVLLGFALVVADETEVAAAVTVAMLADDPEVRELRSRIGLLLHQRLSEALGDDASAAAISTLELAISGALLQVGTGHLAYGAIPDLLAQVSALVLKDPR